MQTKITQRVVDSLKPARKLYTVRDTEIKGFTLRVRPTGVLTWFYDFRNAAGRRQNFKIGASPGLKVEGARRIAETLAGKVASGIDPQAQKEAERIEGQRARVSTLGAFIEKQYGPWALEHLRRGDVAVARLKADFARWLEQPLESFNSWRMESWRKDRLKDDKVKPVTLNRQIDSLRSCLRKAVDWKVIAAHPMAGLKRLKVDDDERVRYLSSAEERRLREALIKRESDLREARDRGNEWRSARGKDTLPARTAEFVDNIRPLVLLAINSGLRRGELFSLRWADIDADASMLTVRAAAAKSGDSRRVPLNAEAASTLKAWKKQSKPEGNPYVFPGVDGARLTNINKSWATVCKLAKLSNFRLHDCRHHFASRLVQLGIDLNVVRELMGHQDIKMTLRYGHLAPDNLKSAVAKLGT